MLTLPNGWTVKGEVTKLKNTTSTTYSNANKTITKKQSTKKKVKNTVGISKNNALMSGVLTGSKYVSQGAYNAIINTPTKLTRAAGSGALTNNTSKKMFLWGASTSTKQEKTGNIIGSGALSLVTLPFKKK